MALSKEFLAAADIEAETPIKVGTDLCEIVQNGLSGLICKAKTKEEYKIVADLIRKLLKGHPGDHWLMSQLSLCLYEQRRYHDAMKWAYKAVEIAPNCPFSLWCYGGAASMAGQDDVAEKVYKGMLGLGLNYLANVEPCGEGLRWTKAVLNDVRYRLGEVYLHRKKNPNVKEARKWLKLHLRKREKGIKSLYTKKEVLATLKGIENV